MDPEWVEEIKRLFGVLTEQLRSDVRQVAQVQDVVRSEVSTLRAEVATEFKEVKALVRPSYAELQRRVVSIESELNGLRERVIRLETRRAS